MPAFRQGNGLPINRNEMKQILSTTVELNGIMAARTFLLESRHADADCLKALDEIAMQNPKLLDNCWLGCASGNHTGWATVEAQNESEARNQLPTSLRGDAKVTEVGKFTVAQIASFHKMK